jgi:transposase
LKKGEHSIYGINSKKKPKGGSLMKDYTGKTIFVGMDVHKKTYSVTAICEGTIIKRDTLKADPQGLISYLKKRFGSGKIKTAYEAGFCGFHLHRTLEAAGIENIVVHAAGIETSNSRVKTDKRDSLKIAAHLSEGKLRSVYIPTVEQEDNRTVTRLRDTFCKERSRLGNQIKSLLFLHGLIPADNKKKVSLKWIKGLSRFEMTPGIKYSIEAFAAMWLEFDEKIKEIDKEIKKQAIKDNAIDAMYQTASGIGPTNARVLANELGDLRQFKNERQLFSYIGFTPSEHSSGEHTRQGHITKQGKPIVRKILVQAAWVAIRHDKELQAIYERIAAKSGAKRAIVAVARRLIGRIRACFRTGEIYKAQRVERATLKFKKQPQTKKQRAGNLELVA